MAMCKACTEIVLNTRGVAGHQDLREKGSRRGATPIGQARINITEYECTRCGTKWEYENDRNDSHVGWRAVG